MAGADWGFLFSRLVIAVPELSLDDDLLQNLLKSRVINQDQYDNYRKFHGTYKRLQSSSKRLRNKSLIQRLGLVAPDIIDFGMINFLRKYDLVSSKDAHALRLNLRYISLFGSWKKGRTLESLTKLLDVTASTEMIDLLRSQGVISATEARALKDHLATSKDLRKFSKKFAGAKSWADIQMILNRDFIDDNLLTAMVRIGIIDARAAAVYRQVLTANKRLWRVFEGAKMAEGWRARALITMTGAFHSDLVDLLFHYNVVPKRYRPLFYAAEMVATRWNDRMLEDLTRRRYRVVPGEAPIKTFARNARRPDNEILRLLAKAAEEAGQTARNLDVSKVSGAARSAQLKATRAELHMQMRAMWEGQGHLIIWGEAEAAAAAAESVDDLAGKLVGKYIGEQARDSIMWQSRNGVDAYISRQENLVTLSSRVYANTALYSGKVYDRINMSLLQGKSAAEMAKDVEQYIKPNVMGGVKYASMRLARTEIANAFHQGTIRNTREMPWVQGYKWHISGSHPNAAPDICDQYATRDSYDMGPGVFPKASVPGKPHPHCLCFITAQVMSEDQFNKSYRKGNFNKYLRGMKTGDLPGNDPSPFKKDDWKAMALVWTGTTIGTLGAGWFLTKGVQKAGTALMKWGDSAIPTKEFFWVNPRSRVASRRNLPDPDRALYANPIAKSKGAGGGIFNQWADEIRDDDVTAIEPTDFYDDLVPTAQKPSALASVIWGQPMDYRLINGLLRKSGGDLDKMQKLWETMSDDEIDAIAMAGKGTTSMTFREKWNMDWGMYDEDLLGGPNGFRNKNGGTPSPADVAAQLLKSSKGLKENRTLYRAVSRDMIADFTDGAEFKEGLGWRDNGFLATQTHGSHYYKDGLFGNADADKQVRMKVYAPKGTQRFFGNHEESEITLSPMIDYVTISAKPSTNPNFYQDVEVYAMPQKLHPTWLEGKYGFSVQDTRDAATKAAEQRKRFFSDMAANSWNDGSPKSVGNAWSSLYQWGEDKEESGVWLQTLLDYYYGTQ